MFFFFQAEDGIRDLVRSRGLGDVYKRQGKGLTVCSGGYGKPGSGGYPGKPGGKCRFTYVVKPGAVSYTHLTLPTSDLV